MGLVGSKIWVGVDIGTSSVKSIAVSDNGSVVSRSHETYRTSAESAAGDEFVAASQRAVRALDLNPKAIVGIGVVGQTPTLIMSDATGRQLGSVLTWRDLRPSSCVPLLQTLGDSEEMTGVSGMWDRSQLPAKLLWLARNARETLSAANWLFQPKDLVSFSMTGRAVTDLWSFKGLRHVPSGEPVWPILSMAGVSGSVLPPVANPWELAGPMTASAANAFGCLKGTPVAVGWTDALAGMTGVGAVAHDRSFLLTGTSDIVGTSAVPLSPRPSDGALVVPREVAGRQIVYGPTQSSGASLVWAARLLGVSVPELVGLADVARDTTAGFLPYLAGERAPVWDANVRGVFYGISDADGPAELSLAVLRGVALSTRHVLESLGFGVPDELHIGGANTSASGWVRARTEVMSSDLVLHEEPQLPALGAASLARAAVAKESLTAATEAITPSSEIRRVAGSAHPREDLWRAYIRASAGAVIAAREPHEGLTPRVR